MTQLITWFLNLHPVAQGAVIVWIGISVGSIGNSKTTIQVVNPSTKKE